MKKAISLTALCTFLFFLLAGCATAQPVESGPEAQLTPFSTSTPPQSVEATAQPTETPQPEPTATPEPLIHEVALQETISSIALRYGVSMDAIIDANPDVDPRTLTVGTRLVIPGVSPAVSFDPSADPLPLEVGEAACLSTPEGGLWCHALVNNPLNRPADGVIVSFTITDDAGQTLTQNVPALLNRVDPGQTLPAVAYFQPPVSGESDVSSGLVAALPLGAGVRIYFPVSLRNERLVTQARSARATVQIVLEAPEEVPAGEPLNLWVAAAAYNARGDLVGARRLERRVGVDDISGGEPFEVSLLIYSVSGNIDSVRLSAEAFILEE